MQGNSVSDLEHLLKLQEQTFGSESAEVADTCLKLADLYFKASNFEPAETLYTRSLNMKRKLQKFQTADIPKIMEHLELCRAKSQPVASAVTGSAMEDTATPGDARESTGGMYSPVAKPQESSLPQTHGKVSEKVEEEISDLKMELELVKSFGGSKTAVADMATKLAALYSRNQKYTEMEPLLVEALSIREFVCGANHASVATALKNLAQLYYHQERLDLAEPLFQRALAIRESVFGHDDVRVADIEKRYALLLHKSSRENEAFMLEQHAFEIANQRAAAMSQKSIPA